MWGLNHVCTLGTMWFFQWVFTCWWRAGEGGVIALVLQTWAWILCSCYLWRGKGGGLLTPWTCFGPRDVGRSDINRSLRCAAVAMTMARSLAPSPVGPWRWRCRSLLTKPAAQSQGLMDHPQTHGHNKYLSFEAIGLGASLLSVILGQY